MNWDRMVEVGHQRKIEVSWHKKRKKMKTAQRRKRNDPQYKQWRNAVLRKFNKKCILCSSEKRIEAHHLKRWIDAPLERFKARNGVVLCYKCHREGHNNPKKEFCKDTTIQILDKLIARLEEKLSHPCKKLRRRRFSKELKYYKALKRIVKPSEFKPKYIIRKREATGDCSQADAPPSK